ncbi:hypothetical protein BN946_scf184985.g46 [Trametes cinnabarina]|uniref:Uncharacterized protein n=1 Tax=Pycnoporus cinnabarinus TaxID=5643 RepID=A0A060SDN6_PYCCI|nr:hypothetical protein BN946_scf184985.g46 [Trametes cinnabarina]
MGVRPTNTRQYAQARASGSSVTAHLWPTTQASSMNLPLPYSQSSLHPDCGSFGVATPAAVLASGASTGTPGTRRISSAVVPTSPSVTAASWDPPPTVFCYPPTVSYTKDDSNVSQVLGPVMQPVSSVADQSSANPEYSRSYPGPHAGSTTQRTLLSHGGNSALDQASSHRSRGIRSMGNVAEDGPPASLPTSSFSPALHSLPTAATQNPAGTMVYAPHASADPGTVDRSVTTVTTPPHDFDVSNFNAHLFMPNSDIQVTAPSQDPPWLAWFYDQLGTAASGSLQFPATCAYSPPTMEAATVLSLQLPMGQETRDRDRESAVACRESRESGVTSP